MVRYRGSAVKAFEEKRPVTLPPPDSEPQSHERFIAELGAAQSLLYRYIYALLPDSSAAHDVLQETNIVLWRKVGEFDDTLEFLPWARGIARYQVLAALRDRSRDRLVLDETLVELIAEEMEVEDGSGNQRMLALEKCLSKLNAKKRVLILQRYRSGNSVEAMAAALKRPVGSVSQALYRIRQALMQCVERQLAQSR